MTDWMPTIQQYMALAEALHDNDETCNATYYHPFHACEADLREYFIQTAIAILQRLRSEGWRMEFHPVGMVRVLVP